jgi:hypothetical protein
MHPLAEFTPCSSDDVLAAFMRQLSSTHLLCALARLQQCGLHPVGSGDYCSIDSTIAGEQQHRQHPPGQHPPHALHASVLSCCC